MAPSLAGFAIDLQIPDEACLTFDVSAIAGDVDVLATLDGRPWFLRFRSGGRWLYLLGVRGIPDPEQIVTSATQELPLVSVALALIMFVRTHHPSQAWQSPTTFGNFVIDDPLLRPRYGFVHHEQLARQVDEAGGAATIAFIPWNARRTSKRIAQLYMDSPRLSICPHGCEHIEDEFATEDRDDLRWRAGASLDYMRLHEQLSGVPFEPVMVFPQGRFSAPAMEALRDAGFLAAANSTFLAAGGERVVRLKHLLEPAVTAYGGLPLFRRRSPGYLERFRYDAVLGKPLVLVEHHQYFSDAGAGFRGVFERIRGFAPSVDWAPLGTIARRLHLVRHPKPNHHEIRFYASRFQYPVRAGETYLLSTTSEGREGGNVLVNGKPVDVQRDGGTLRFEVLPRNGDHPADVVVETASPKRYARPAHGRSSRLSVAVRRYLSEGRDNYVTVLAAGRPTQRSVQGQ
jgi:hypothetical protein